MEFFNSLNLTQIKGGTKLKQGDLGSVLSYSLTDENGQEITSFDNKTAYINLVLDDKIWFTTTTLVDISRVTFRIDKAIPIGLYYLEIKIDDYIFPSDRDSIILIEEGSTPYDLKELVPNYDINMTLKGILSDLSQKGIDINDLKTKMSAIYNNALADHAEITAARGTHPNLRSRLDEADNKQKQTTARMDTFTTLESGSTTGDAELIDGRVGADGVVYTNIGGAIRNQITDITQGNVVLTSEWLSGFVDANGGIEANANVITQTELQPISAGEKIRITIASGYSFGISWYNSKGILARRASSWITETTEITNKYSFYRLSILKTGIALSDSNKIGVKKINYYFSADEIKNKIENLGKKIENAFYPIGEAYKYLFSKAICIGDSLTRGYYTSTISNDNGALPTYPKTLAKITGWTVTQAGKSGATAKSWHDERLNLFDYSAHDVAIIYLGTNAGLETYSATETNTTNIGCYRKIIQRILTDNPNCKIFMCTVSNVSGSTVETTNSSIYSLAGEFSNCFVLELKDNGIVDLSDEALHPHDPVHFAGIGYMTQAYVISCLIKKTIADNVASFDITS